MRTYTIELRVDFQSEDRYDLILEATREAAKALLATSTLLQEKRKPQIMMQAGDMFVGTQEIELFGEGENTGN